MSHKAIYKHTTKHGSVGRGFIPCGNGDAPLGLQCLRYWVPAASAHPHRCLATAGLVVSDGPVPSRADVSLAERELWEQQVVLQVPLPLSLPSEPQEQPRNCVAQFKAALSPSKCGRRMTSVTIPWSWSHPDADCHCV